MSRTIVDLRGQRFGRLVALEPTGGRTPEGLVLWRCQCDCGKSCVVSGRLLRKGERTSCGCASKLEPEVMEGRRFGLLTVLDEAPEINGNRRWCCRCDCGAVITVWQPNLLGGRTKSCGCRKTARRRK
ncbi:MAG: hypothetical protein ACI4OL_04175 [Gemmiger sp.]